MSFYLLNQNNKNKLARKLHWIYDGLNYKYSWISRVLILGHKHTYTKISENFENLKNNNLYMLFCIYFALTKKDNIFEKFEQSRYTGYT